jgi:hypothetical protein
MSAGLPPPSPLSADRLRSLAAEAWPLLPVTRLERKDLLLDEAAALLDRLLVQVARGSGALAVAIGECLAALLSGAGPMRLGYSGIGDYARENLSLAGRTAFELARLSRELRTRPLLREAVRSGEVSIKKAEAVLPLAVGDAEASWVARARRESVRELREASKGGAVAPGEDALWARLTVELPPSEREEVEEALSLAGRLLGAASPRWQRVEALCQEYLGEHPAPEGSSVRPGRDFYDVSPSERRAWLEREHDRWSFLFQAEAVPAPEPGVDDSDRARQIDARLRELAGMRRGWDELLCHLCLLLLNTGLWRAMGFADVEQYAAERLGISGRALRQRAWLERRLWELPPLRQAMRDGRLCYEKALLVARCPDLSFVEAWIELAEAMTCIALKRAVEADEARQMCARDALTVRVPEEVRELLGEARRAVSAAEGRRVGEAEALLILARHFTETWKAALKERSTAATRARDRDRCLCTVPGCSRAADQSHHIKFRSHGGGDQESNRTSVCWPHHRGIHHGFVRVRGTAPDGLRWTLGEEV